MTQSLFHKAILACALLGLVLVSHDAAWAQIDTGHAEDAVDSAQQTPMQPPPPVSGEAYITTPTSETESNYLRGGLTLAGAYSSNISGGQTPRPGGSYSIWPSIAFDKVTIRSHSMLSYSPGFTIYPETSSLNQVNQAVSFALQYRLSPNVTASVSETFNRSSNIFNQPNPLTAIFVSGSAPPPQQAVIPPVADQTANGTNAEVTYQCGEDCMIGASGRYTTLHFANSSQVSGLYDSSAGMGSVFYSHRLRDKYSLGVSYQYQDISSSQSDSQSGGNTNTQTQAISAFFTIYFRRALSLSFSGGPQHSTSTQAPFPAVRTWSPLTTVSFGWQGTQTSLAASYSRIVSGAGGLNGAYHSNTAAVTARWQTSRTWSLGASARYFQYETLNPLFTLATSGGHTTTGTVSVQHSLGEHLTAQAGYSLVKQNYSGNSAGSIYPNTSQIFVSLSYQFARPLQ